MGDRTDGTDDKVLKTARIIEFPPRGDRWEEGERVSGQEEEDLDG